MEYSRGMPTIPEDSFARLLLRNTSLEEEQVQKYLNRLCKRLKQRKVTKRYLGPLCGKKQKKNHISNFVKINHGHLCYFTVAWDLL